MANKNKFKTTSVLLKHYNSTFYGAVTNANSYPMSLNYVDTNKLTSCKAIGLFVKLSRLSHTFTFTKESFNKIVLEGKDAINSGLNELIRVGLLVTVDRRDLNGKFAGIEYHLFESPVKADVRRKILAGAYNHVAGDGTIYKTGSFPEVKEVIEVEDVTPTEIIENSPFAENPQHLIFINSLERNILNSAYARKLNITENNITGTQDLLDIVDTLLNRSDVEEYKGIMLPNRSVNPESEYNKAVDLLENDDTFKVIETYLYNFGEITKGELIRLVSLTKYADAEVVAYAVEIAKDKAKTSAIAYIERTVADWNSRKLYNLLDVEVHLHLYSTKGKNYDNPLMQSTGEAVDSDFYYNWLD